MISFGIVRNEGYLEGENFCEMLLNEAKILLFSALMIVFLVDVVCISFHSKSNIQYSTLAVTAKSEIIFSHSLFLWDFFLLLNQ